MNKNVSSDFPFPSPYIDVLDSTMHYVAEEGMKTKKAFEYWVSLCLEYNSEAKASKKKPKKAKK